jgi:hypothetical protein
MSAQGSWRPYTGSGSIALFVLLVVAALLVIAAAWRLRQPVAPRGPDKFVAAAIVTAWSLAVVMFLVALVAFVLALVQQDPNVVGPADPITKFTAISAVISFIVIWYLNRDAGFWVSVGSAIVGTIAAPMIFELPFDLIVMSRTYAPRPAPLFILLFFLPLFIVEVLSLAMLTFSPRMRLSRQALLIFAGMLLIFAVWALFGMAYPYEPIPIVLNVASKIVAFAVAVSLFVPQPTTLRTALDAPTEEEDRMSSVVRIPGASVRRADPTPTPKHALRAASATRITCPDAKENSWRALAGNVRL